MGYTAAAGGPAFADVDKTGPNWQITFQALEWAYDDSGAPIHIPDTSSQQVPVPGTPFLTLLGLGAIGVQTYRPYTAAYKAKVDLEATRGVKTVNEIGQDYGVHPAQVGQWKREIQDQAATPFE